MTTHPATTVLERVRMRGRPAAGPAACVVRGQARFTVLTPRLLRLEWSATGAFEDRGTFAFPTRYGPVPPFTARDEGGTLVLDTGALTLRYMPGAGPFTPENLQIAFTLNGAPRTWQPEQPDTGNLRGTRRTLDGAPGDVTLDPGLLSRDGWTLFDDSRAVLYDPADGWVHPQRAHETQDWYFFGYGHDYRAALADYTRFGGAVPLIPRFVLGAWWSRFWAYSAADLEALVQDFAAHDLPLDVLVIDMDWHTPHAWTGYTWNRELFPDPAGFLKWVHDRGLRVTLNLHPAEGVQRFEEIYERFAAALGQDTSQGAPVAMRISDPEFVRHYFELLHHPMEEQGVDFWWMDWQQGDVSELPGLDPLGWINHLHFNDSRRRGLRPMLYSRWGGLGNHRYYIGFSGDTFALWSALQFLPYFTATASNVCYGWWSHDIGGHFGPDEPELYARWVQFGALSPCLRLHSTNDPAAERRPWAFPGPVFEAAQAAFHWRYALVPYLYTMARAASDTGIALCRPMYYDSPEDGSAYVARYQYYLGDAMIAAPIVHPAEAATGLAPADVWLPAGTWIDYQTGETFDGPRWVRLVGDLRRMPMLLRAGAILPLAAPAPTTDAIPQDQLILTVFPGEHGTFRLYEDDGTTEAYLQGQAEWTPIEMQTQGGRRCAITIGPVEGHCAALPPTRAYEIRLEGTHAPATVHVNGVEHENWSYDPETLRTTVAVPAQDKRTPLTVVVESTGALSALGPLRNTTVVAADVARLLAAAVPTTEGPALLDAVLALDVQTPGWADALARLGGPFAQVREYVAPEEAARTLGTLIVAAPADGSAYDLDLTWTLHDQGRATPYPARHSGATGPLILDAPFAFGGAARPLRWTVEATITWRGVTWTTRHRSASLFPSIPAWQAAIFNREQQRVAPEAVVDAAGRLTGALPWQPFVQDAAEVPALTAAYGLFLAEPVRAQLEAGDPLAAYAVTSIVSPDAREAVIGFRAGGPVRVFVNGAEVAQAPAPSETEPMHAPPGHIARRTVPVPLRAGTNMLVIRLDADPARAWWAFAVGAALLGPDDLPLAGVEYVLPPIAPA
jgi:alpha-glucosidase